MKLLESSDDELPQNTSFVDDCILEDLATGNIIIPLKPEPSEDSFDLRVSVLVEKTVVLSAQNRTVGHDIGIKLYRLKIELVISQKKTTSQPCYVPE